MKEKDNIYNRLITELVKLTGAAGAASPGVVSLDITSSLGVTDFPESSTFSGVIFTSKVQNIPAGYSIDTDTHVISYPATSSESTSLDTLTGAPTNVVLGLVGSTFTVNSTVDLVHATDPTITLTAELVLSSVLPGFVGVKSYHGVGTPDTSGLTEIAGTASAFSLTSTSLGRLYIVLPTTASALVSITDHNGLVTTISDFDSTTIGSLVYYWTNYDTLLTGTDLKTFSLNF